MQGMQTSSRVERLRSSLNLFPQSRHFIFFPFIPLARVGYFSKWDLQIIHWNLRHIRAGVRLAGCGLAFWLGIV